MDSTRIRILVIATSALAVPTSLAQPALVLPRGPHSTAAGSSGPLLNGDGTLLYGQYLLSSTNPNGGPPSARAWWWSRADGFREFTMADPVENTFLVGATDNGNRLVFGVQSRSDLPYSYFVTDQLGQVIAALPNRPGELLMEVSGNGQTLVYGGVDRISAVRGDTSYVISPSDGDVANGQMGVSSDGRRVGFSSNNPDLSGGPVRLRRYELPDTGPALETILPISLPAGSWGTLARDGRSFYGTLGTDPVRGAVTQHFVLTEEYGLETFSASQTTSSIYSASADASVLILSGWGTQQHVWRRGSGEQTVSAFLIEFGIDPAPYVNLIVTDVSLDGRVLSGVYFDDEIRYVQFTIPSPGTALMVGVVASTACFRRRRSHL